MGDIQNPRILWLKFALFLAVGLLSVAIALLLYPSLRLAALLALAIWAFCRAYYFAFYVIEHYADPTFRYAGITSFIRYAWRRRRRS
jgi:hypothetical protein